MHSREKENKFTISGKDDGEAIVDCIGIAFILFKRPNRINNY